MVCEIRFVIYLGVGGGMDVGFYSVVRLVGSRKEKTQGESLVPELRGFVVPFFVCFLAFLSP